MRVYLRNARTGQYYASGHRWVSEPWQALDLEGLERASQLAFGEDITEAEVVLSYEDPVCQLAVPIAPDWSEVRAGRIAV